MGVQLRVAREDDKKWPGDDGIDSRQWGVQEPIHAATRWPACRARGIAHSRRPGRAVMGGQSLVSDRHGRFSGHVISNRRRRKQSCLAAVHPVPTGPAQASGASVNPALTLAAHPAGPSDRAEGLAGTRPVWAVPDRVRGAARRAGGAGGIRGTNVTECRLGADRPTRLNIGRPGHLALLRGFVRYQLPC
jgi:hypothetical protein